MSYSISIAGHKQTNGSAETEELERRVASETQEYAANLDRIMGRDPSTSLSVYASFGHIGVVQPLAAARAQNDAEDAEPKQAPDAPVAKLDVVSGEIRDATDSEQAPS